MEKSHNEGGGGGREGEICSEHHGTIETKGEVEEEQEETIMDEEMMLEEEQSKRHAGDCSEDMEQDETEGPFKSIRRSFKRMFKRSGDKGAGNAPQPTLQGNTSPTQASANPVSGNDDVYDFSHPKRGRAVIINNEKFQRNSGFNSRPGSKGDEDSLKEVFRYLGFDVKCYNDLNAMEMKYALEKENRHYNHHNADCLAVVILSHGDSEVLSQAWSHIQRKTHQSEDKVRRDLIFGVDGSHVSTASVIRTFQDDRCPGLQGKPRLFFFQACRGGKHDDGIDIPVIAGGGGDGPTPQHGSHHSDGHTHAGRVGEMEEEETDMPGFHPHGHSHPVISPAPIFKDFLVMYATAPGYYAWRRPSGTWFVQSLQKVIMEQLTPHMSLTQALTRVSRMVAHGYQSQGGGMVGKKQMPVLESMLVKDVYFNKK